MSSVSGSLNTCDECGFQEFVPGWLITEESKKRWAHVRRWIKVDAGKRLDICSVFCLTEWAARGEETK